MEIKIETIKAATRVLDVQRGYCGKRMYGERQESYYRGMRDMLELIISNYYENHNCIIGEEQHGVLLTTGEIIRKD